MIKECKYCHNSGIAFEPITDEKDSYIVGIDGHTNTLIVFKKASTENSYFNIPIKYCPICGKKLGVNNECT